jgi:uncharacterized protein (DUF169 family)
MDYRQSSRTLESLLGLGSPPIAIAFRDRAPEGVERIAPRALAGCGYWTLASSGKVFYTEAADHYGCPIGMHTHNVEMPAASADELRGLIGTMVQIGYLRESDIPQIPHRTEPFGVAVYAPLAASPCAPDLVLLRGNARQMMLVAEAAQSAGVAGTRPALGRPTCAVLPDAIASQRTSVSFGCVGNRVYTGLPDDEAYVALPASRLEEVLSALLVIVKANETLRAFHLGRVQNA